MFRYLILIFSCFYYTDDEFIKFFKRFDEVVATFKKQHESNFRIIYCFFWMKSILTNFFFIFLLNLD
jgi:hypothetical protein